MGTNNKRAISLSDKFSGLSTIDSQLSTSSFTLTELLVVISIIAILTGLAFPAYHGVQEQARRFQAKNDLVQIVTAISAYMSEYGRYPLTPTSPSDTTYGTSV